MTPASQTTILALETSSATASAALVDAEGAPLGESGPIAGAQQARRVLECVHEALAAAGAGLGDVTTVVCGLGPGTFTGLRIGIATARALAQAADLPLAGVPSLEALAGGLAAGPAGRDATWFVPLIDGRRREVFAAVYRRGAQPGGLSSLEEPSRVGSPRSDRSPGSDEGTSKPRSGGHTMPQWAALELVASPGVVSADALRAFLEQRPGAVVGGDGALAYADRLPPVVVLERAVAAPSALMVARTFLAGSAGLTRGFTATLPLYGREPDAVPR